MIKVRTLFLICGLALMSISAFAAYPIFDSPVLYPVGEAPTAMVAVDLDNDGDLDLVTADSTSNTISVLINDGTGTFSAATTYATGEAPVDISAGDLNGDGLTDLVTANYTANTLSVLWNAGSGSFPTSTELPIGTGPRAVAIEQLNEAGLDIIVGKEGSANVSVIWGNGDGTFQPQADYALEYPVTCICIGDFDLDGYLDFMAGVPEDDGVLFINDQTGSFPVLDYGTAVFRPTDLAAGDFDADGYEDLVIARPGTSFEISAAHNDGGVFHHWNSATMRPPGHPFSVACPDLNTDGYPDIVASSLDSGNVKISMNRTLDWYQFENLGVFSVGTKPRAVVPGDFDLDGDIDLAVANSGSNDVAILFNYYCGDVNQDHIFNLLDVTTMIACIYLGEDFSVIEQVANVNGSADGKVNLSDLAYLIGHIYLGGPVPMCR